MSELQRITRRGLRKKTLAQGRPGFFHTGGQIIVDMFSTVPGDPEYIYRLKMPIEEVCRMILSMRAAEMGNRLTPEEFGRFAQLARKALGEFE